MASSLPQTEHAALFDAWIARYKKATGTNRSKLEALNPVLEELESEGVQAFPVKGMDLLLRCYASLGHRSMADIDLLVKEEDLHRISGPLSRAGFSPVRPRGSWKTSSIEQAQRYHSEELNITLALTWGLSAMSSPGLFWARAVHVDTLLGHRQLLHPEDAFLFMILYAVTHRGRLHSTFVQDVSTFLENESSQIDWTMWCGRIHKEGVSVPVYHGLRYAEDNGCASVPEQVLTMLAPATRRERLLYRFYRRAVTDKSPPAGQYLFPFVVAPGWSGKWRVSKRVLGLSARSSNDIRAVRPSPKRIPAKLLEILQTIGRALYIVPTELLWLVQDAPGVIALRGAGPLCREIAIGWLPAKWIFRLSRRSYDKESEVWKKTPVQLVPSEEAFVEASGFKEGAVLSVGCGGGREAIALAREGFTVTAVDHVPAMVEATQANAKSAGVVLRVQYAEVTQSFQPDGKFSLILLANCFYSCIPHRRLRIQLLRRLRSAATADGWCYIHFVCSAQRDRLPKRWRRLQRMFGSESGLDLSDGVFEKEFLGTEEAEEEVRSAGWEIRQSQTLDHSTACIWALKQ